MIRKIWLLIFVYIPLFGMSKPQQECCFENYVGSINTYLCMVRDSILRSKTSRSLADKSQHTILLYGPAGSGKKKVVYAFAKSIDARIFYVDSRVLAHKGPNENLEILHGICAIFEEAIEYHKKTGQRVIVVIDNIEEFAGVKENMISENHHQAMKHVNIIYDQCKNNPNIAFFFLTTTHFSNIKDQIVSRSQVINWPLPDTQNRQELFEHFLKSHPHELSKDLLPVLVQFTQNFAGGDIEKAVNIAHQLAQKDSSSKIKDEHIWEGLFQAMETNDRIAKISIPHHKRLLMLKHLDNAQKLHASQTSLLVLARLTPCFSPQDLANIINSAQKKALANNQTTVTFSNLMDGFTQTLGANTQLIKTYAMRTGLTILGTIVSAYMIIKGGPVITQKLFTQTPPPRANG